MPEKAQKVAFICVRCSQFLQDFTICTDCLNNLEDQIQRLQQEVANMKLENSELQEQVENLRKETQK